MGRSGTPDRGDRVRFEETLIEGAYIIDVEPIEDERGFFARTYCVNEFSSRSLHTTFVQSNISYNRQRGTIRGMHYQEAPFEEVKIVSCTQGKLFDVIIDLRPTSTTYLKWISVVLSAANRRMLYIPEGCAHGFQTLENDTQVFYQMGSMHEPCVSRGIRWNDDRFHIEWPLKCEVISEKDTSYKDYQP
ncbi:dTDP-4-dehydrorhamnose 3,5-epimerase [Cohnella mopanensis]|uniref:dTDP-4-dehydrorhamnose 3,5-epimerase n=1 Tax=Cohnella mopanensis TaxID=2911966 RepID=UPI001EF86F1A|nr:dTDP-4-dehydrorhamnose 3,5-epimerase [Cohnella mopanensis]